MKKISNIKIDGTLFRFALPLSKESKNRKILNSFVKYCIAHPEERFWQALRNWSKSTFIYRSKADLKCLSPLIDDTFYFEGKDK